MWAEALESLAAAQAERQQARRARRASLVAYTASLAAQHVQRHLAVSHADPDAAGALLPLTPSQIQPPHLGHARDSLSSLQVWERYQLLWRHGSRPGCPLTAGL
jgi:hypothetical protein